MKKTFTKHGVKEEAEAGGNIWGELGVVELGQGSLLISLDQDLADTDTSAHITKTLFHCCCFSFIHKETNTKYVNQRV